MPSRVSQISGRQGARVRTEVELGFAVSLGVVNSQPLFAILARLREIALDEASKSYKAMPDRRLCRSLGSQFFSQQALGRFQG